MIHFLEMAGTIFNLVKINTVACMCNAAHSLGHRVDDWLHSLEYKEWIADAYGQ